MSEPQTTIRRVRVGLIIKLAVAMPLLVACVGYLRRAVFP